MGPLVPKAREKPSTTHVMVTTPMDTMLLRRRVPKSREGRSLPKNLEESECTCCKTGRSLAKSVWAGSFLEGANLVLAVFIKHLEESSQKAAGFVTRTNHVCGFTGKKTTIPLLFLRVP